MSQTDVRTRLSYIAVLKCIESEDMTDDRTMLNLQRHQFNLEAKDAFGHTPLTMAAAQGKTRTLAHLLARGADITYQQPNGDTGLTAAIYGGHYETAAFILSLLGEYKDRFLAQARLFDPLKTSQFEELFCQPQPGRTD